MIPETLEVVPAHLPLPWQSVVHYTSVVYYLKDFAPRVFAALSRMHEVHEWCLPGTESRVPTAFRFLRHPSSRKRIMNLWLESLYAIATKWPPLPDAPWMPKTRELGGKKAKVNLIESEDVLLLSAEAISRWLPPDVDNFLAEWQRMAAASRARRDEAIPHWDAENSVLTYQGMEILRFKRFAERQVQLLDAFEKSRWERPVGEKDMWENCDSPKRLSDTVRELKKRITNDKMRFALNGFGQAIWLPGLDPKKEKRE